MQCYQFNTGQTSAVLCAMYTHQQDRGYCYNTKSNRLRLKCDDTRAETRFCLPAKRTSPFKSAGASLQTTTGSRGVRISVSNAGYTMFRGSVMSSGYLLHSPVSPSLPLPHVTVCHHISTGLYSQALYNSDVKQAIFERYSSCLFKCQENYFVFSYQERK